MSTPQPDVTEQLAAWLVEPTHWREFADLSFVLVPDAWRSALPSLLDNCQPDRPLLVFWLASTALPELSLATPPLLGIELLTHDAAALKTRLDTLVEQPPPGWHARPPLTWPGGQGLFAWVTADQPLSPPDALLSAIINRLLVNGRPLRHYGCTLFYPLDLGRYRSSIAKALTQQAKAHTDGPTVRRYRYATEAPDATTPATPEQQAETQAWLYFQPLVRQLMFDLEGADADDALRPAHEWRAEGLDAWRLTLGSDAGGDDPLRRQCAVIESLTLHHFYNDLCVLALRVRPAISAEAAKALENDADDWWHPLAFSPRETLDQLRALQCAAWMRFTRLARVAYPSFMEQKDENKIDTLRLWNGQEEITAFGTDTRCCPPGIPQFPGMLLSPVLRQLLAVFFGDTIGAHALDVVLHDRDGDDDDRLFVNVAYALAGPAPIRTDLERLFSFALFVDRPGDDGWDACDGYAYSPAWVQERMQHQRVGLWDDLGQRVGFTGFSHVYLGHGDFFSQTIAPTHVPNIYQRMTLQALFYQASLRRYAREISAASSHLSGRSARAAFQCLHHEFITFVNRYWFHDLSSQLQGREIYARMAHSLGLKREYDLIKDELERADEALHMAHDQEMQGIAHRVAWIGLILALLGLWFTLLPLAEHHPALKTACLTGPGDGSTPELLACITGLAQTSTLSIPTLIALAAVIGLAWWLRKKPRTQHPGQ